MPLPTEQATEALGATLAERLKPGDVVGLKGDLGAGKTTLARAIIRAAAADPDLIVPSPTFTLVEVYDTPRGAYWHFDLYRLDDPAAEPIEFFTDNDGAFFIYQLRPGAYRLALLSEPELELQFTVPERAVGLLDLGRVPLSLPKADGADAGAEE